MNMFWIKKQLNVERRVSNMQYILTKSFSNVKRDTQNIFNWLNFLHQKNLEQEYQIKQLKTELDHIPKKPEDIRKIIDSYYSFDNIMERIKIMNERIDSIPKDQQVQHPELGDIQRRIKDLEEQKKATIREKVVKRVTRNSKEYVKSLIMSYITKYSQISGLQLKEMIVYDQGLCSKSSFYRILEELEAQDEVGIAKKGKQKYYLHKTIKKH